MRCKPIVPILLSVLATLPLELQAETHYDIRFRGLQVAEATVAGRETADAYAAAGRVMATGMVQVFARVRFDLSTEGRVTGTHFRPARYREDVDTGDRASEVVLSWAGPMPVIERQSPAPAPYAVPPADAAGTVDPLTALWRLLRDADRAEMLCDYTVQVYDGARRSQFAMGPRQAAPDGITCAGEYRRLDGFSAEAMSDRQSFPFTAHYAETEGVWRLTEVRATSLFGPIRITRRN